MRSTFFLFFSFCPQLSFFVAVFHQSISQVNTCFHLHGAIHHDHQQMTPAATNQTFDEEKNSLVLVSAKKYCRWNGKKMKISCCKVDDLASEVTIVFKASVPAFMTIQYIQNNFRLTYFVFGPKQEREWPWHVEDTWCHSITEADQLSAQIQSLDERPLWSSGHCF